MKVAVQCDSPLLQRSLEFFLKGHLSSLKQCDLVLRDKKVLDSCNSLYISADEESDIKKPFSRTQLFLALEEFYKKIENIEAINGYDSDIKDTQEKDFSILQERIELITQEYKNNILHLIKAFYE